MDGTTVIGCSMGAAGRCRIIIRFSSDNDNYSNNSNDKTAFTPSFEDVALLVLSRCSASFCHGFFGFEIKDVRCGHLLHCSLPYEKYSLLSQSLFAVQYLF